MELQNLKGWNLGHIGHDLSKMAHKAEHEAYKDAKIAGHVAY